MNRRCWIGKSSSSQRKGEILMKQPTNTHILLLHKTWQVGHSRNWKAEYDMDIIIKHEEGPR